MIGGKKFLAAWSISSMGSIFRGCGGAIDHNALSQAHHRGGDW
jgi:hypothetical protein